MPCLSPVWSHCRAVPIPTTAAFPPMTYTNSASSSSATYATIPNDPASLNSPVLWSVVPLQLSGCIHFGAVVKNLPHQRMPSTRYNQEEYTRKLTVFKPMRDPEPRQPEQDQQEHERPRQRSRSTRNVNSITSGDRSNFIELIANISH